MKHNDKVTCTIKGIEITDARISIGKSGRPYICHNEKKCNGSDAEDMLGYKYSWVLDRDFTDRGVTNLLLVPTFQKGDILIHKRGYKIKILEVLGDLYFISALDDFASVGSTYTEQELKKNGCKLVTPVKEYSHDEIAKALGIDAKDLKIKE